LEHSKIGIIIQARLNSTRFPNKVLAKILDKTVIEEIIDRAKLVEQSNVIVVATSNTTSDDRLATFLETKTEVKIFRGSEENVLNRYVAVAQKLQLNHIVRLTADNPCIDAQVISDVITKHIAGNFDYSYTKGYPLGMNVEVVKSTALYMAAKFGQTKADKEHVTFFVRNNPKKFKLNYIFPTLSSEIENLRLTLDTPKDYLMLQLLFDYLKSENNYFSINDIIQLWQSKPYIFSINESISQKKVFNNEITELKAAVDLLEKQEMNHAAKILKRTINEH